MDKGHGGQMAETGSFTPLLGASALSPFYDAAIGLATREGRWRSRLVAQINPKPDDRILDVGCGTGSLALLLKRRAPSATVFGLDPDPQALAMARRKVKRAGADIQFLHGFANDALIKPLRPLTKIVISLVLHQTPVKEKLRILNTCRHALGPDGEVHIADYGEQRGLMRLAFRSTVQALDGVNDTEPHAQGHFPAIVREAGLKTLTETSRTHTPTGQITTWIARR
jgi:ubiquinone/menaquinone biosynthesis C-methylase UbiE